MRIKTLPKPEKRYTVKFCVPFSHVKSREIGVYYRKPDEPYIPKRIYMVYSQNTWLEVKLLLTNHAKCIDNGIYPFEPE